MLGVMSRAQQHPSTNSGAAGKTAWVQLSSEADGKWYLLFNNCDPRKGKLSTSGLSFGFDIYK